MRKERKQTTFTFKCYEDQSANLKIRLKQDRLQQTTFFRALIEMYIGQDELMIPVLDKIKEKYTSLGSRIRSQSIKDFTESQQLLKDLGITKEEKDQLFDIIESSGGAYD